jgi:hypothetical protein
MAGYRVRPGISPPEPGNHAPGAPDRAGFKLPAALTPGMTAPTPTPTASVAGAASPDPGVGLVGTLLVVVVAVLLVRRFG